MLSLTLFSLIMGYACAATNNHIVDMSSSIRSHFRNKIPWLRRKIIGLPGINDQRCLLSWIRIIIILECNRGPATSTRCVCSIYSRVLLKRGTLRCSLHSRRCTSSCESGDSGWCICTGARLPCSSVSLTAITACRNYAQL